MACQPLGVGIGQFIPLGGWSTAPSAGPVNGRTVTRTASGITVTGPGGASVFHATLTGYTSKYHLFGDAGNVLILESENSGVVPSRNVTLVDFSSGSPVEKPIFLSTSSGPGVNEPVVHMSPGTGSLFFIWSSSGTTLQNIAIRRGDSGDVLCSVVSTTSSLGLNAEATATQLRIKDGGTVLDACPLPAGQLSVSPASQPFGDVVVGGDCPQTPSQKTFTLKNTGTDCLKVNSITSVAPFTATPSKPYPVELKANESFTVTVSFAPASAGSFGPTALAIDRTPAKGDSQLSCQGKGVPAVPKINFPTAHDFGHVPVGTTANYTVNLNNVGDKNLTVTVPGPTGGLDESTHRGEIASARAAYAPEPVSTAPGTNVNVR
jgi:hypothetical protein